MVNEINCYIKGTGSCVIEYNNSQARFELLEDAINSMMQTYKMNNDSIDCIHLYGNDHVVNGIKLIIENFANNKFQNNQKIKVEVN